MSAGEKETIASIQARKNRGEKIPCLTAYDYPTAKLFDEAGVPLLLVGDSLGMVVLGYPDTVDVSMEDILHHLRAAARAKPCALLGADLPSGSYATPQLAVANAQKLKDQGAEFVKAEGGLEILECVKAITGAGIPFMGHLGMLPQHIREEGRYRIKGKVDDEKLRLIDDAKALEQAGAFSIVLELVTPPVAEEISRLIQIPTIGIGSGLDCDGQILVYPDLVGLFPWFTPKFVKPRLAAGNLMQDAVRAWMKDVASTNN
ncbi:MAG: 3-methyl-2-oxobutanoate hydroxymethyltransferase [Verrucomicrobiales bacterium]|nr:3-methyl-2-oxobutanoate hydroxymethyltransferase [Verrucomicrobiales bacterium]